MHIQPYLFFGGRADEAIAFYEKTLGAKLSRRVLFKDNPDGPPADPAIADNVMHASLQIGDSPIMLSDGHGAEGPRFQGFSLTLTVASDAEVDRLFAALAEGGNVMQAPTKTFFSSRFAMATDRFGVMWIILVAS
jgi:PhnB protein